MTANQRRPGFRLPWSSEMDGSLIEGESTAPEADAVAAEDSDAPETPVSEAAPSAPVTPTPAPAASAVVSQEPQPAAPAAATASEPTTDAEAAAMPENGDEFMRDLVAAMRGVADEARQAGMKEIKTRADERVSTLEADADQRREELRSAAESDIAGVGEWAKAEAERIKQEAEQKVVARRARLDDELKADAGRTEAESAAVRAQVAAYERELDAYHAQLSSINDPSAFAAAAKRMPKAPTLDVASAADAAIATAPSVPAAPEPVAAAPQPEASTNGVSAEPEESATEVLAKRLAELDAQLPSSDEADEEAKDEKPELTAEAATITESSPAEAVTAEAAPVEETGEEPVAEITAEAKAETATATEEATAPDALEAEASAAAQPAAPAVEQAVTEVVVKGLGSFGAITGFRQSLSGVDGIESVALSLGQTGEFVFRATHAAGFDVSGAIAKLEGNGAKIEDRPEGGLRVTLEKPR